MSLIPYDPFREFSSLTKNLSSFFADFPSIFPYDHPFQQIRVDIRETGEELIATCDLPGLKKKDDVKIEIHDQTLVISGKIEQSAELRDEKYHRRERISGSFHRSVLLPAPVSADGAKATYRNGILEIRMPKLKGTGNQGIDIEFR
ncbi:MAG: heat-shock protein Hsp20 [Caldibacillus debilis]|uniref:Heat-shock protein Hsp20 n=1 Tax=Caldibacillus debilis TaxID=301148 RepID=A0A3E0K4P0_9BACI|nr:Hsp20/alpha crystallin family protein [Caldibacillus debilis]REJ28612.1 MAG: heat-shock protein Hsp20 [Caldibacillus debilis]